MVAGGWGLNWRACGREKALSKSEKGWEREEIAAEDSLKGWRGCEGGRKSGRGGFALKRDRERDLPSTEKRISPARSRGEVTRS